jgi:outer membrane protein OmpA-like peptidoglycan-associated protein
MGKIGYRNGLAATAALSVLCTVGCAVTDLSNAVADHGPGSSVRLTERVPAAALIMVTDPAVTGTDLRRTITATAQPSEYLDILAGSTPLATVVAAQAPAPVTVTAPGRPAASGPGASSYQSAVYHRQLGRWDSEVARDRAAVTSETARATATWASGLRIPAAVRSGRGNLADQAASAASALAGLQEAGDHFGSRCVIVLYTASLSGSLSAGELSGDAVIVVTPFVPTAAAASAAQADLLGAGAARAAVLGPEATAAQIDHLITADLNQQAVTETLSGPALFPNDSAALLPGATRVLTPLLALLRRPGATAVVNGYASTTGSMSANDQLSQARAAAVVGFFEAHGVSPSALVVVGHGSTALVAPGPSGANRRVVVVIGEPAGGAS